MTSRQSVPFSSARALANRAYGRAAAWRRRRHDYRSRTLVVSRNWGGSVQTFYHFLLGYYCPLMVWLEEAGPRSIIVRDCGPMNGWFEYLPSGVEVEIVHPGRALGNIIGGWTRHEVVRGLDDPARFRRGPLMRARSAALRVLAPDEVGSGGRIVVVDRQSAEAFYHGPTSETEMSGSERRSVPNLAEAITGMDLNRPTEVVDLARVPPPEQVRLLRGSSVLVAQHGAGLAHMLWMEPGSTVIEIHPPLPEEAREIFARLARTLGHAYVRIPQDSVHAPVDVAALRDALKRLGLLADGAEGGS